MIYLSGVANDRLSGLAPGYPWLGLMLQPRSYLERHVPAFPAGCAYDNGCYGFWRRGLPMDLPAWRRGLLRIPASTRFVTVPDAVGDHLGTLKLWSVHAPEVQLAGHRPAFVLQDGCRDLSDVPSDAAAVFVGGSDAYKFSTDAARVCWQARDAGLWVHVGRVNSADKLCQSVALGADSADGTFLRFGELVSQLDRLAGFVAAARTVGGQLDLRALVPA